MNKKEYKKLDEELSERFTDEFSTLANMLIHNNSDIINDKAFSAMEEQYGETEIMLHKAGALLHLFSKKQLLGTTYMFYKYNMDIIKAGLELHMKNGKYPDDMLKRLDEIANALSSLTERQVKEKFEKLGIKPDSKN